MMEGLAYIRSVETTYADGARRVTLTLGEPLDGLKACVDRNGKVTWCEDWARLTDWSLRGKVRRVFHPGHGDPYAQYEEYFVTPYDRSEVGPREQSCSECGTVFGTTLQSTVCLACTPLLPPIGS